MNKNLGLTLLTLMLAWDIIIKRNDDNTTTVSHDCGPNEEAAWPDITVPNSIYNCCNVMVSDEAWDLNDLINSPQEEGDEHLDDDVPQSIHNHEVEAEGIESVASQYDPSEVIN